jgi:hypothetical protein
MNVSTKNIHNIADEAFALIAEGKKPNLYQLQQKHGYSEKSARAYKVKTTKTWKEIMDKVDDEVVISRFMSIVKEGSDRDAISAGKEVLNMKGRYPKQSVTEGYKRTIKDLLE